MMTVLAVGIFVLYFYGELNPSCDRNFNEKKNRSWLFK